MTLRFASKHSQTHRPFGIWLAAGYALFFIAFLPLFTRLWALTFPPHSGFDEISPPQLIYIAGISLTIAALAILTWQGHNAAHILLIALITLHYGLIAFENFAWLLDVVNVSDLIDMFFMRMARAVIVPAIYIWYFTEPEIKEFFKHPTQ